MTEPNCPTCDLPHPSENPYCFCQTKMIFGQSIVKTMLDRQEACNSALRDILDSIK